MPEDVAHAVQAVRQEPLGAESHVVVERPLQLQRGVAVRREPSSDPPSSEQQAAARAAAVTLSSSASASRAASAAVGTGEGTLDTAVGSSSRRPPAAVVAGPFSKCARRRPYHVVLTAASGVYQEWQSRIAYYHYKKLKAEHACSDIGGFTRLLNTPNGQPDGLMDEMPTVVVKQLGHGRCSECDHGFIVMNRPWGVLQFTKLQGYLQIPEQFLFIMETDHLLLRPVPNEATRTTPVGFGFYYMTYKYDPRKLRPVVAKYHDPEAVDDVGPSPVIIHKEQLRELAEPWWRLCLTLKQDREADAAFGWVLEMWGWALNAARLGVRHKVLRTFQAEPGGPGIPNLEAYYIYHYTFDLEVWNWKWSKRHFMSSYPPPIEQPPRGAQRSTPRFVKMMNEAMGALQPWRPMRRTRGGSSW
jgi:hypothetical protein